MAVILCHLLLTLLLSGQGLCQCYSESSCAGDVVSSSDQRDCCVSQNGVSYNDAGTCRPCIVHGFRQSVYDINEGARLDTDFSLNVVGTTQFSTLAVSGTITSEAAGTANGSDFHSLTPIAVINNNANPSTDIRLFTVHDEITLEYEDRVLLRFTPAQAALIPVLESVFEYIRNTAIFNIIDNDPLYINFGEADYSIVEGSDMLNSPITLQFRYNQNPFTVRLSSVTIDTVESMNLGFFINSSTITNDSRAKLDSPDPDFSDSFIDVTIPANHTTFIIPTFFTINDDNIDEDEQSFAVVAEILDMLAIIKCSMTTPGIIHCFGTRGATEIRITDNDPMVIGFTQRIRTVSENEALLSEDLFPIDIDVATERLAEREHPMIFRLQSDGTAIVEPLNFVQDPEFDVLFGIRLAHDEPIQEEFDLERLETIIPSRRVEIRNDLRPEDEECFTIRIFPVDVPGRRELFICNEDEDGAINFFCETTICIEDNDNPFRVVFVEKTYTVDESVGTVNVCVNLTHPMTDILDETANVFVIDDPSSIYIPPSAPLATPDAPNFLSQYPMAEGTDFAQQTRAVNVIDGIIITEERRLICYNQPIYDDPCLEPDEYAGLTLGVIDDSDFVRTTIPTEVEPFYDQTAILIVDDDSEFALQLCHSLDGSSAVKNTRPSGQSLLSYSAGARVGLEQTFFRAIEDVGVIELCAVVFEPDIVCPVKFPFHVQLYTADGSAVETMDYGALDVILMFDECERHRCVNVSITLDLVDEPDEFFTFHLNRTTDLSPRIELDPVDGRIEIVDDDVTITVGYNPVFYTSTEGQGFVVFNITIFDPPTGGTPRPFTVVVNTQDGTARAGPPDNDYVAVSGEIVQFNVGDTFQTHTIIINNDMECEDMPNEEFFSNIAFDSGVEPINVINPHATVTIDDSGEADCIIEVGYDPVSYVTTETAGFVDLTIRVFSHPGGSPRPFSLAINTEDGTARVVDGDYQGVTDQIIAFEAGDVTRTHRIIINNDTECEKEPNDNFFSNIALNSGIPDIFVTEPRATVTIDDTAEPECEPIEVGYDPVSYVTTETARFVDLTIRVFSHPGGSPRPFSLAINTEDGTARVVDGDYQGVTDQIITFEAGDITRTHRIIINNDTECEKEPNDNFFSNIALNSGIPDIFVTEPRATVTIDDTAEPECEPIEVGYDPVSYVTTETARFVDLTIRVFSHPGGSPRPFFLAINTEDGTARVVDGDYISVNDQIIQFSTGDITQTHRIIISDDNIECEIIPNENFFSNIALDRGIPEIYVTVPQARVTIDGNCHAHPVESFQGKVSSSGISFIFTWTPPRIGAELTTNYDLTCIPLLQGIPSPRDLSLSNNETSAEMSVLYSGVTYNCSISTVTAEGSSQPKHLILSTPEKVPSDAPEMFEAVAGEREVVFSLSPPPITQHNGPLTSYTLSCSPSLPSQPLTIPPESTPSLTATGLSPNTDYTCSVTADNSRGSGPPENLAFRTVNDYKYFQLRLSGLLTTCPDLVSNDRSLKVAHITREVVDIVTALCPDCGFTDASIDKQSFSCYSDSPSFVTYRARLEGTSRTDSDHFISLIEQWVSEGASVIVTEVLLKVDSKCLVEISNLSEDECVMKPAVVQSSAGPSPTTVLATDPMPKEQDSSSLTTILTVVGVIVIVVIIAITATIIAVVWLRSCQAQFNVNKVSGSMEAKSGAIQTTSNEAYEEMEQGRGGEAYEMMDVTPTVTTPTKTGLTSADLEEIIPGDKST